MSWAFSTAQQILVSAGFFAFQAALIMLSIASYSCRLASASVIRIFVPLPGPQMGLPHRVSFFRPFSFLLISLAISLRLSSIRASFPSSFSLPFYNLLLPDYRPALTFASLRLRARRCADVFNYYTGAYFFAGHAYFSADGPYRLTAANYFDFHFPYSLHLCQDKDLMTLPFSFRDFRFLPHLLCLMHSHDWFDTLHARLLMLWLVASAFLPLLIFWFIRAAAEYTKFHI